MTIHRLVVVTALWTSLLSARSYGAEQKDPVVKAPAGELKGQAVGSLDVFKGIPYAMPPVGSARWKAPSPMPHWTGTRDAREFGPACMQPKPAPGGIYSSLPVPLSEDCLTLNIWSPRKCETHLYCSGFTGAHS